MKGCLALLSLALVSSGCNEAVGTVAYVEDVFAGDPQVPASCEIVIEPEATVRATTSTGQITVTAGKGLRRFFTWESATRSVVMQPREKRWYGSLGMYYPGPGSHWFRHNGISRGVLEEGQQHFESQEEALRWLHQRATLLPLVFSDDGLVVGWSKNLDREQLNVEVWQLCVSNQKPSNLPGSSNDRISISKPSKCRRARN